MSTELLCAYNKPGGDCEDAEPGKPWTHNPECYRWRLRTESEMKDARIARLEAEVERLRPFAQHLSSCPHSTVREIPNPPKVFLECSCGLGAEHD